MAREHKCLVNPEFTKYKGVEVGGGEGDQGRIPWKECKGIRKRV